MPSVRCWITLYGVGQLLVPTRDKVQVTCGTLCMWLLSLFSFFCWFLLTPLVIFHFIWTSTHPSYLSLYSIHVLNYAAVHALSLPDHEQAFPPHAAWQRFLLVSEGSVQLQLFVGGVGLGVGFAVVGLGVVGLGVTAWVGGGVGRTHVHSNAVGSGVGY